MRAPAQAKVCLPVKLLARGGGCYCHRGYTDTPAPGRGCARLRFLWCAVLSLTRPYP